MTVTVQDLVNREVHYCVSALVSTLAQGYGAAVPGEPGDLADMIEQAFELASPVDDWEEAALQAGWTLHENQSDYTHPENDAIYNNVETLCEIEEIGPYQREVFEHWIVSDWLADRLAEKGEKVDKDFAGLTVWARTTTGQGIASDSVIEAVHADLVKGA